MKQFYWEMAMIVITLAICMNASGYDFEVNGIYYGYDTSNQSAFVTYDYTKEQTYSGNIVIPNTVIYNGRTLDVTAIGDKAFKSCQNLLSVSLPSSIRLIGESAFSGCVNIVGIELPTNLEQIKENAFYECTGLKSINLPANIKYIKGYVFGNCISLESVTIPNGIEYVGVQSFQNCVSLKSLFIPKSVSTIDRHAFSGCTNLETVVLEDWEEGIRLEGYPYSSFENVSPKYVYIGRTQTSINYNYNEYYPFSFSQTKIVSIGAFVKGITIWSNSVEKIYSFSENPETIKVEFLNYSYLNAKLFVPVGTKEKYLAAEGWKNFLIIEEIEVDKMWNGQGVPDDESQDKKKCEKPTIRYSNGKLLFESATEGAICQSIITDSDITSYSGNEVQLGVTYNISVYATAAGYENSDVATATLCWIDVEPKTEGIENSVSQVRAKAILIQTNNGTLNVTGVENGADITVYSPSGMMVGSAKSISESASVATSLKNGEIAIVKIGDKSVKVVMK